MLNIATSSLADVTLDDTDQPGFRRYIKRTPLGVVLVIAPWKSVVLSLSRSTLIKPQVFLILFPSIQSCLLL